MKTKYLASVRKGAYQSKYRPENKTVRRMAGKAYGQRIKGFFNQRALLCSKMPLSAGERAQTGFTLIELLVVIGIIAILAAVVIVAVNPAHQFAIARDTQRAANVAAILDAVDENMSEHKGVLMCNGAASILTTTLNFLPITSDSTVGGDLGSCLVPDYLVSLPYDPTVGTSTDPTHYSTGYSIKKDPDGHITISANSELPGNHAIQVTR
ncbi:MAG: type II secretion system protein [Candidatus Pacebacteria bacterium]|nr:type II secretion system protein [Candidatus Paceibacterota bacterium]